MKKIKVAQIVTLNSPNINGVTNVVKNISLQLQHIGNEVEIIAVDSAKNLPELEKINGVLLRRFKSRTLLGKIIPTKSFYEFMKVNIHKYDVIHIHGISAISSLLTAYILKTSRKKVSSIFNPHYHKQKNTITNIFKLLYEFGWVFLIKVFNKIIFVSKAEKNLFLAKFGECKRTAIIYNGVDLNLIRLAKPYVIENKLIIFVGGIHKYKNIDNLIKAFNYLPTEFKLMIIGNGPHRQALEDMMKQRGLHSRIKIMTNVNNEELYKWYKTCTLLVNLSAYEAFGIVLIEAIAAGKHVICSDIPSFLEIAEIFKGVHPISLYGSNPKNLAEKIQQVAYMPEPDNQKRIIDFTWENIGKAVDSAYSEVLRSEQ